MLYGLRQRAVQTQHLTVSFCSGEVTTRRNEYHKKYTVKMLLPSYVQFQKRMIHGKASDQVDYPSLSDAKSKQITRSISGFYKRKLLLP